MKLFRFSCRGLAGLCYTPAPMREEKIRTDRWARVSLWALLLAGLALRVWGAWAFRHITDPDCGVVALMAKHMAEGRAWPVFFYGQSYMGSLEPALSALCCRLLGVSGFAVGLGTALAAAGALLFTYLWGRDAGGRTGGLAALALCVIGPPGFFLFQFAPRGGYMIALILGVYVMWHASSLSRRLIRREHVPGWQFLLLGFAAGLGWWSNQLITSALAASALVLAIGWRGRLFNRGVLLGLAGFFVGSSPFWIWNALNGWDSFNMLSNLGAVNPSRGLRHLMTKSWRFIGGADLPRAIAVSAAAVTGITLLAGLLVTAGRFFKRREWKGASFCAVVFILVSCGLFIRSAYAVMNTTRYLVPLVPAAAVLAGVAVSALPRRGWSAAPVALTILLILPQLPVLKQVALKSEESGAGQEQVRELSDFLEQSGVEAVYSHFRYYPFNFHLNERWPFTDMRGDRVPELARRSELAQSIAVYDNHGHIAGFLNVCGGDADHDAVAGRRMTHHFQAPLQNYPEMAVSAIAGIVDGRGRDLLAKLTDRNADTFWESPPGDSGEEDIEITFAEPVNLARIRLLAPSDQLYPRNLKIKAVFEGADRWTTIHEVHPVPRFQWSGSRPYWGGRRFRLEYRLPAARPMVRLRLSAPREAVLERSLWAISEMQFFGPASGKPSGDDPYAELTGLLERRGVGLLYSDRGPANVLKIMDGLQVQLELEPKFFPEQALCRNGEIQWTPRTAFLVLRQDAPVAEDTLKAFDIRMRQTDIGPWVLFDFEDAASVPEKHVPIHWTGFNLIRGQGREHARLELDRAFSIMRDQGDRKDALAALSEALKFYPNFITTAGDLLDWLGTGDGGMVPDELQAAYREAATPRTPVMARFENGIELVGISFPEAPALPGDDLPVRWYWRCPPGVRTSDYAVFVHFRAGPQRFQDDHIFLEHIPDAVIAQQSRQEIFCAQRLVRLPYSIPGGSVELEAGLYNRTTGKRLRQGGGLINNPHSVKLTGVLDVLQPVSEREGL